MKSLTAFGGADRSPNETKERGDSWVTDVVRGGFRRLVLTDRAGSSFLPGEKVSWRIFWLQWIPPFSAALLDRWTLAASTPGRRTRRDHSHPSDMLLSSLPFDVLLQIFRLLPTRDVIRLRTVSTPCITRDPHLIHCVDVRKPAHGHPGSRRLAESSSKPS